MKITITTAGRNSLGLRETLERFATQQWLPAHCSADQTAAIVLDQFRRAVADELELLDAQAELDS